MRDAIDSAAVIEALKSVGLHIGSETVTNRQLVNIFAKAEASPNGSVRGFRHTMLEDTDISSTRHARAAVGGLISGLVRNRRHLCFRRGRTSGSARRRPRRRDRAAEIAAEFLIESAFEAVIQPPGP